MLFNSFVFLLAFLPTALAGYYLLAYRRLDRAAIGWLVACSLFFYGWWNPVYLALILFSIGANYLVGEGVRDDSALGDRRKPLLIFGIVLNLGLLGYFKYANFFVDNVNALLGADFNLETIILPLAISFFTFQQIAYLVDAYRGLVPPVRLLDYSLFVSFFPQLIAGPIVHHKEMMPQFSDRDRLRAWGGNLSVGLLFLGMGLFKKVVLADSLAPVADPIFATAESGGALAFFDAWAGILAYTLQLYFDFSGYSDMAIGCGRMFGIRLPVNFFSPYSATSIIEFWNRWHITLSRFLRDYLYLPLVTVLRGPRWRYANLATTMLLGGLWHGAGWSFVLWGALHGTYLATNHAWRAFRSQVLGHNLERSTLPGRVAGWLLTSIAVMAGLAVFRAETLSGAATVLSGAADLQSAVLPAVVGSIHPWLSRLLDLAGIPVWGPGGTTFYANWLPISLVTVFLLGPNTNEIADRLRSGWLGLGYNRRTAFLLSWVLLASLISLNKQSAFLYFQF